MHIRIRPIQIVAGVAAGAMLAGGSYAFAASQSREIHACVSKKTHALTVQSKCPKGTSSLSWGTVGPKGPTGAKGATGASGVAGAAGVSGAPATVSVGTVTTGTTAAVTNTGSSSAAVLNFTLPATGGATAYGQVWPGASGTNTPVPVLKNSNGNVVAVVSGDVAGTYGITVKGCSASDQSEPVITATANDDPGDPDGTNAPVLVKYAWQTDTGGQYNGDLGITFTTVNSTTGASIDSDFAFTVIC